MKNPNQLWFLSRQGKTVMTHCHDSCQVSIAQKTHEVPCCHRETKLFHEQQLSGLPVPILTSACETKRSQAWVKTQDQVKIWTQNWEIWSATWRRSQPMNTPLRTKLHTRNKKCVRSWCALMEVFSRGDSLNLQPCFLQEDSGTNQMHLTKFLACQTESKMCFWHAAHLTTVSNRAKQDTLKILNCVQRHFSKLPPEPIPKALVPQITMVPPPEPLAKGSDLSN